MTLGFEDLVCTDDFACGVVLAEALSVAPAAAPLSAALSELVARRAGQSLDVAEEARRQACRNMLRHGAFKPTGRSKPASEYLLKVARQGELPRINGPVDANNLVSLDAMVPISVWDLDRSGSERFVLCRGSAEQHYVFNQAGQQLDLSDLICGAALEPDGSCRPIVTPIKDSMATKIAPDTTRAAALIYFPLSAGGVELLSQLTARLAYWLGSCGPAARARWGLLLPAGQLGLAQMEWI